MSPPRPTDGLGFAWSRVVPIATVAICLFLVILASVWMGGRAVLRHARDFVSEWTSEAKLQTKVEQAEQDLAKRTAEADAATASLQRERRRRLASEQQAREARLALEKSAVKPVQADSNVTRSVPIDSTLSKETVSQDTPASPPADPGSRVRTEQEHSGTGDPSPIPTERRDDLRGPSRSEQSAPQADDSAFQTLSQDVRRGWSAADTFVIFGGDTGYVRGAEELRRMVAAIETFDRVTGGSSNSAELRSLTVQKLEALVIACSAHNTGNAKRRAPTVPCPLQR